VTTVVLARLVLRHWAATVGVSAPVLAATAAVSTIALGAAAHAGSSRWRPPTEAPEVTLMVVALGLFTGAVALGILGRSTATLPRDLGFLATLPVPPAARRRAAAAPGAVLGAAVAAAVGLPAVMTVARTAGYGFGHAALGVGLLVAGGLAGGRLAWTASHRMLWRPGFVALRLTGAYCLWIVLVAASLVWPPRALEWAGWPAGIALAAPLGWPLPWWSLVEATDVAVATAVLAVAALCIAAGWSDRERPAAGPARRAPQVRTLTVRAHAPVPLAALVTAVRLRRHPRALEALVVSAFLALTTVAAAGWVQSQTPARLAPTLVAVLGSQVATAFGALVRGLSPRSAPVEAAWGLAPGTHVAGEWLAVWGWALLTSAPSLVPLAVWLGPAAVATWVAALLVHTALAVAVSTALVPPLGDGGAEAGALLAYVAADSVVLRVLGPFSVVAGGAALVAAVVLERRHRRRA
jgi:hypothetical protein